MADKGGGELKALYDGGGEVVNVLAGGETMPAELGIGEIELKPTRSLRLAPCVAETGFGAASWVAAIDGAFEGGGSERPGMDGLLALEMLGVADWKSSKSSSSWTPPADSAPNPLSMGFAEALLPFNAKSLGGVLGGMSSASKLKMSISGSFFFGGSGLEGSRRIADDDDEDAGFRRDEADVAPSSYSSYSSNLSRRLFESWKSEAFPPYPPPSP